MDFIKRHWSTLILIAAIAAYLGMSMGSNQCPMCVASSWVFGSEQDTATGTIVIGEEEAPSWELLTLEGEAVNSRNSRGKVSVLVYWASWCAPCREEIPALIALRNEFSNSDLEIIGVSLDENRQSIETFVKAHGINYTIARNNESLNKAFGPVRYIPSIVILDQEGNVHQRYTGLIAHEVIRSQIKMLLAEKI